jgi:hypothetical protein
MAPDIQPAGAHLINYQEKLPALQMEAQLKSTDTHGTLRKKLVLLPVTLICGLILTLLLLSAAHAQSEVLGWGQSNTSGFGNPLNTNVSALAVFESQMYAGTWNENGSQVWHTADGKTWTQIDPTWSISNSEVNDIEPYGGNLYFGTAQEYYTGTGEIWRTDGSSWQQVAADGLGDANNIGFNALATFSDTLIAATTNYSTGVEVWSSTTGDVNTWQQVNTDGFGAGGTAQDIVMEPYAEHLYLGLGRLESSKAELWRTGDGITWTPVFTDGLGVLANSGVSSMAGFKGNFYIGLRNLTTGGEVWRSENGLEWTPVFTGGLGTVENDRPYGLIVFNDQLYLVFSNLAEGAQVWLTSNGETWERISSGGWGDAYNAYADYFDKSAAAFNGSLYIGTSNLVEGGEVWQRLHTSYLPLVSRVLKGISGHVTENGQSAAGVPLELRFFDGATWSSLATQTTNADGDFIFAGAPTLKPGQIYYVGYYNEDDLKRLWRWETRELITYTAGSQVEIGNFDIADITMLSPAPGATVRLPYTFVWEVRPATPSDSYEFNLYDSQDNNPYFYTDPALGYVDYYTLASLPQGFATGTTYSWEMWVYSPDGGHGISLELRDVIFEE